VVVAPTFFGAPEPKERRAKDPHRRWSNTRDAAHACNAKHHFALHEIAISIGRDSEATVQSKRGARPPQRTGGNDRQIVVRLPAALVARVDRFADQLRAELPGTRFARSEAVRVLLTRALDQAKVTRRALLRGSPSASIPRGGKSK
jgi:hypothetical protein